MAEPPADAEFERRFIEWYVWAHQTVSFDSRRCRAAAWAAATASGTQEELTWLAQRAAFGPDLDELAGKPSAELSGRAHDAARAAMPKGWSWMRTYGIIAAVVGVVLLVLGGVCFAFVAFNSGPSPSPPP